MPDYYKVLAQKIQETRDDPVKMRDVVYEAARLALRWQVQEHWPGLSIMQSKSHIRELEDAIARLEADAAGPGGRDSRERAAVGLKAGRQSRNAAVNRRTTTLPTWSWSPIRSPGVRPQSSRRTWRRARQVGAGAAAVNQP